MNTTVLTMNQTAFDHSQLYKNYLNDLVITKKDL